MALPILPIKYAIELPNTKKPGQTGIYRNINSQEKITDVPSTGVRTLYENFEYALKTYGDNNCIGHRPYNKLNRKYGLYEWQTYKQVGERRSNFGSGLLHLSETVVKNNKNQQWTVGIYSINRPEWFITDQAVVSYNLITVALYDTLGPDSVEYVINHAEIPIIVATANLIPSLIQLASKIPVLKVIVSMDDLEEDAPVPIGGTTTGKILKAWAADQGILLVDFKEVEKIGRKHRRDHNPPSPQDIACICYTSGTTGLPKGVLLTHAGFIGAISSCQYCWSGTSDDLAHIMGRLIEIMIVLFCGSIGYFRGDVFTLVEDMTLLKPTIFVSVPRLLTRIYAKLRMNTVDATGIKGTLSRKAVAAKLYNLENFGSVTHPLWDTILFNKIKAIIGGRVRLILTGSAPISPEILQFLRIAFACDIGEGYGQTEGIAMATLTTKGENKAGHVGGPVSCVEVKLVDVPEMDYLSTDKPYPRGELCSRGTSSFVGYYKDEAKTKEAIDQEGWVHTGDIASIDERGAVSIIDRKKNLFKLSQGEYVAPEKIENVYLNCNMILQIYVHGDSLRDYLIAIIVPDPETFIPWANQITGENISVGDDKGLERLINYSSVNKAFLKEMHKLGTHFRLRGFENVKAIHLERVPFSVENNLLTPTLKLRRHEAKLYFRKTIEELYNKGLPNVQTDINSKL
nr:10906_t:CDS:10 [Entrophospora candida]